MFGLPQYGKENLMKEQYLSEIMQYVNEQDETQLKWLAEMSHYVDRNRLQYIFTFVSKIFGSH